MKNIKHTVYLRPEREKLIREMHEEESPNSPLGAFIGDLANLGFKLREAMRRDPRSPLSALYPPAHSPGNIIFFPKARRMGMA